MVEQSRSHESTAPVFMALINRCTCLSYSNWDVNTSSSIATSCKAWEPCGSSLFDVEKKPGSTRKNNWKKQVATKRIVSKNRTVCRTTNSLSNKQQFVGNKQHPLSENQTHSRQRHTTDHSSPSLPPFFPPSFPPSLPPSLLPPPVGHVGF